MVFELLTVGWILWTNGVYIITDYADNELMMLCLNKEKGLPERFPIWVIIFLSLHAYNTDMGKKKITHEKRYCYIWNSNVNRVSQIERLGSTKV